MIAVHIDEGELIIRMEQSLESAEWLKIVCLKEKLGYSHEEALELVHKLAKGLIKNIDDIPKKGE